MALRPAGPAKIPSMNMLRVVIVILLCLGLSACTLWKDKPPSHWSQATGGEQLERFFWQERKAKQWASLQQRMSATYVYLAPDGAHDRDATLQLLQRFQITDYTLGDFEIHTSAPDVIVTYTASARGSFDGQPLPPRPRRVMSVWQHTKQGWITTAHAELPAAPAAAPAP